MKNNNLTFVKRNLEEYRKERGYLNQIDREENTLLWYAVVNMNLEMMNILITNGADVNKQCKHGNTPMHYAFMVGDKIDKNKPIY